MEHRSLHRGSSSGTGAGVAAGLILGGIGTDTGGSIRGPAALCGIAGLKPTYGLVSRAGVAPAAFSLDHIGPMAWTAEDCALMLQALAGHDPRDPASADRPVPDYSAGLGSGIRGTKIGVIHHFHEVDYKVSDGVRRGIDAAIAKFRDLDAEIREVQVSPLQDWGACGSLISICERAAAYEEWARTRLRDFSERVQRRLMLSALVSGVDYVQAVRRRRELRAELKAAMQGLDVVLTASQTSEAPKIDEVPAWDTFAAPSFTMPFNVAGYPAITVCAGFGAGGLPVAIQLAARPFAEAELLRIADAFEKATELRNTRPALSRRSLMDLRSDPLADAFDLGLLTEAQRYVWLLRPDLRETKGVGLPAICDFLYWWYTRGVVEYPAFADDPSEEQYRLLAAPAYAASAQSPPISHFLAHLWRERDDLATVYPLDTPAGRRGFVEWILSFGRKEVPIQDLWIDQALRDWLLSPDPDTLPVPRLALDLWKARPDLQKVYDVGDQDDREGLREWLWTHGIAEHRLAWMLDEPPDPATYIPPAGAAKEPCKRCPPPVRDDGVNLIGFATAEFGLGEDLRMAARALDSAGIPFSVFEVPAGPRVGRRDLSVSRWISHEMPHRTSILCMAAFEAADFYLRYGREGFAERFVIGYWPWELPRWPAPWVGVFDLVDEVWASSHYTQAAFAASAPVPVLHMPMAVDLPRAEPQPRARFALRDGVFQFLLVFDWHSWPARKNPTAAVEAFRLAFPLGNEPVGLAIKMIGIEPWSIEFAAFRVLADADPRVTLLPGTLDRPALTALYRCCDAYVSLHRAEGFGRTLAEAMLMGKPVVATNWSGNTDFMDSDTGCLVDFGLQPVGSGDYPYADGQVWAEPDVHSAAEWLCWLAADWSRAAALGRAGRARIIEQFGVAPIGARYAERLTALWSSAVTRPQPTTPAPRRTKRKAKAPA